MPSPRQAYENRVRNYVEDLGLIMEGMIAEDEEIVFAQVAIPFTHKYGGTYQVLAFSRKVQAVPFYSTPLLKEMLPLSEAARFLGDRIFSTDWSMLNALLIAKFVKPLRAMLYRFHKLGACNESFVA